MALLFLPGSFPILPGLINVLGSFAVTHIFLLVDPLATMSDDLMFVIKMRGGCTCSSIIVYSGVDPRKSALPT